MGSIAWLFVSLLAGPGAPAGDRPGGPSALETLPRHRDVEAARAETKARPKSLRPRLSGPVGPVDAARSSRDAEARALGLRPLGDGGYAYAGEPGERFDAKVRRDGTVEFEIDSSVQVKLDGLCLVAICVQTKTGRRARRRRRRAASVALTTAALLAEAALGRVSSGSIAYGRPTAAPVIQAPVPRMPPPFPLVSVQGRYGTLPAPVASMSDFMDRTFELRLQMAEAAAIEDLEAQRRRLPAALSALWNDSGRSVAQRRAAILELWADLDVVASHTDDVLAPALKSRLDEEREQATLRARRVILHFVQRHAPAGSPDAFTKAELAAFNRRAEAVPFEPYRAAGF